MRPPFHLRLASWVLLVSYLNVICPVATVWAEVKSLPAGSSAPVKVNRTLPSGIVSPGARTHAFSSSPTDDEILRSEILPDPLVPVGKATTPAENAALVQALLRYEQSGANDNLQPFVAFLAQYPDSAWAASLHLNLGLRYFATAWFSKALTEYAAAWTLSKDATDPHGRAVGDRSIGELLELNARLGRFDVLQKLFDEIKGRVIHGSSLALVTNARDGLWFMQHHPEVSFRCGPGALERILAHQPKPILYSKDLFESCSTQKGMSLTQVWKLAQTVKLDYQMARRTPGAAVITPAVVNWKVGHYAALLSFDHGIGRLEDPTFGKPYTASTAALDAEASGYFLIPAGPLPPGWTPVGEAEGDNVWGKGIATDNDDSRDRDYDYSTPPSGDSGGCGMPVASATLMICSLKLADAPLFYSPPKGPSVTFSLTYNQREAGQPTTYTFGNVGNLWTYGWLSYVNEVRSVAGTDGNGNPNSYTYAPTVHLMGGGSESYSASDNTPAPVLSSWDFSYQADSRAHLVKTDVNTYVQTNLDGSSFVYGFPSGTNYFLTKVIDPSGNALTLNYDDQMRLFSVTDAMGQVTTLYYENSDPLKLTKVKDPFNRTTLLAYNAAGQLSQITDMLGLVSQLSYATDGSDFITSMTTPYGTSKFAWDQGLTSGERWLTLTDPLGNTERVEGYNDSGSNYPPVGPVPAGMTTFTAYDQYRNTFYWDKRAYAQWPNVNAAHTYHWLHLQGNDNVCSGVLENEKNAAEANRIWYNYPGQPDPIQAGTSNSPTKIGRVLDNGATQLTQYTYDSLGNVTSVTDPLGRVTTSIYDSNGIDLLETDQITGPNGQHDVLAKFTYNSQHEVLTATDASGQVTTYTYNSAGQRHTVTNAKHETTTYWYTPDGSPLGGSPDPNASGYLVEVDGAVAGAKTSFTYRDYGLVRTVTDSEGYAVTTDYDKFNRPTAITYPDGTSLQNIYDRLDLIMQTDRLGRVTQYGHNALRQLVMITDPLDRHTLYDRCGCGALQAITDPAGHTTNFTYDIQGRPTGKIYPDGTSLTYAYEAATSRRQSVTDALGQVTHVAYNLDDTPQQVTYTDLRGAPLVPATPSVSYTYDPFYPRPTTMIDGTGSTIWTYNPVPLTPTLGAGRIASIAGPLANSTITYAYDELGRETGRSINGPANASGVVYDALGRVQSATNPLGAFTYNYVDQTSRLLSVIYPTGQATGYAYYPNAGTPGNDDQRLQTILNVKSGGAALSAFSYGYDAAGRITTWAQQTDGGAVRYLNFAYDAADQLIQAAVPSGSATKNYWYVYDKAGNRAGEQIDTAVTGATINNLNQVTALSPSGPIHFSGTLNEPSTVTVNGQAATVDASNNFSADVPLSAGANVVTVAATNGNGVTTSKHFQYTVANGVARTLTYDLDGGMTNNGAGQTYTFDAANRLSTITQGGNVTTFVYNGMGQRVQEKLNGTIVKQWVWCPGDTQPCEERNASNIVTKRFYAQGEQISGVNFYTTRDHLGSVRELTDSTGAIRARYDYTPYGLRTKLSGDLDSDFGFDGMYYHSASGLYFTLHRAYDPVLGRWTQPDPAGEAGGINLFQFVRNDPINLTDLLGLWVPPSSMHGSNNTGSAGEYWSGVGNAGLGELKGAGQILSLGTYQPTYSNPYQQVGGYTGAGLTLIGGAAASTTQAGRLLIAYLLNLGKSYVEPPEVPEPPSINAPADETPTPKFDPAPTPDDAPDAEPGEPEPDRPVPTGPAATSFMPSTSSSSAFQKSPCR
ncbi:MAG TPA: RHS repeat-associated core domain-containing protein [Opitutaceae bacterium]|jgi:RHS repeat-associated protein|nr:RHS repeat-associated core domain-containing protein [Opitutaceae bacterium]